MIHLYPIKIIHLKFKYINPVTKLSALFIHTERK